MDRLRRKHKHAEAADLDVTPFMNLMIVLVPVLLLSMVFTHTTVIDLNFPAGDAANAAFDPDAVHLEVIVRETELVVADGRGGKIKSIPASEAGHDFETLSLVMQEVKRRLPEKREVTVLLEARTDYQTLVSVMDKVRSYPTVQALEVVQAELFPVISLGDTPVAQEVAVAGNGTGEGA
ncbi:MAG: biopolymer transporter ExbD [Proteobacteria bacterium]|nr:biopolymer transporter ExbD [Pseudomonadota bacterium]